MFANALFLAIRNLGTFKLTVEDIAEVGTAGRYIETPSRQRAEARAASGTLYGRNAYTNGAGVRICLLLSRFPKTSNCERAEVRCPAFFLCGRELEE